jgi:hypothetical protein
MDLVAASVAGRLRDRLIQRLGSADDVFMDVGTLRPGDDFRSQVHQAIRSSTALVAIIGPRWEELAAPGLDPGREDHVVVEIHTALAAPRVRVIPVLVERPGMPEDAMLHPWIRSLAERHAVHVDVASFDSDVSSLVAAVVDPQTRAASADASRSDVQPAVGVSGQRDTIVRLLTADWDRTAEIYLADLTSIAWLSLYTWLASAVPSSELSGLSDLVKGPLRDPDIPPNVRLLHLLRWLEPEAEHRYKGIESVDDLARLLRESEAPAGPERDGARETIGEVLSVPIQVFLPEKRDGGRLLRRLRAAAALKHDVVVELRATQRALAHLVDVEAACDLTEIDVLCLKVTLNVEAAADVRASLDRAESQFPMTVPWFERVRVRRAGPGSADAVAKDILAMSLVRSALAESTILAERETHRIEGRPAALRRAALAGSGQAILLIVAAIAQLKNDAFGASHVFAAVGAGLCVLLGELGLATSLAGDYRPFPAVRRLLRVLPPRGCLYHFLLLILCLLGGIIAITPFLLPAIAVGAQIVSTLIRLHLRSRPADSRVGPPPQKPAVRE